MFNIDLETSLININFIILFVAMILYWLKSSFFLKYFSNLPDILIIISNILQFSFLCIRWANTNHFPLSNLYESILFLSYCLTSILIIFNFNINIEKKNYFKNFYNNLVSLFLKNNNKINKTVSSNNSFLNSIFGSILTPLILLLNTFANFSLPIELKTANALVPALKSNWLLMHVTVMILSYAALLCGCLFSIAYLILTFVSNFLYNKNKKLLLLDNKLDSENYLYENSSSIKKGDLIFNSSFFDINKTKETEFENTNFFNRKDFILDNLVSLMLTLDNLSYRILGLGFPLLTMGLLSGAVWANQTWGSYWSWDPKETWALITWFIFAIYFHTRLSRGWNGFKSSLLASFGFIIIWICYLGVNLMGKGLHSYGFLS
uniref:heme attachment to plastid cytochrome c n=1 Tax=Ulva tepida TaxID=1451047 RepID=UPI0021FB0D7E|nr:heme attachment to plastid cytochrome c [Ulva tepida]UXW92159.1 heme attachment to plastid cytochrome c [Ulva tepida]